MFKELHFVTVEWKHVASDGTFLGRQRIVGVQFMKTFVYERLRVKFNVLNVPRDCNCLVVMT